MRLAPLLAPIMHRVNVFVHFFFVPNRLLWKDWEPFITGGRLGTETPPIPPRTLITDLLTAGTGLMDLGSLVDYLGHLPLQDVQSVQFPGVHIDAMPAAAYYKVWYDYYRDRNYLGDNTVLPMASGTIANVADARALFEIRNRDWQKEYFTSALPWTQRGNQVLMPLIGTGSVTYLGTSILKDSIGNNVPVDRVLGSNNPIGPSLVHKGAIAGAGTASRIENIASVNITNSSVTINDLRRSLRLQEWLERNALAGSRYNESIMAHFGRKTSDARLQRAEYLGGGKVTVKISEVVTTAFSDDGTDIVPAGNMAGHGLSFGNTNRFKYNCEEHGFVLGIMSVMPTSAYMQGAPRMFYERNTFLDYPWPTFAHLGEQTVKNYELFAVAANLPVDRTTQPVFGYQSRYADWKYLPSTTHGDFRIGGGLDFWHLTRSFGANPVLGATFVNFEDALQNRVFAVSGTDTLWCYIYNNCKVVRSLPYFGTPML